MVGHTTEVDEQESALPGGILGIDAYSHDDGGVTDVQVIERDGDAFCSRWLGEENRVAGVGTPEGWECIGACTVEWDDEAPPLEHTPVAAEAVFVDPDSDEWTTATLSPWRVDE